MRALNIALLVLFTLFGVYQPATATAAFPGNGKIVKIICVYPAGGGIDIVMRSVAQVLTKTWESTIIIENHAGAGTTIATTLVAKSPADGYTLLATDVSFSIAASLYAKLQYDPQNDLAPVSLFASVSQVLAVNSAFPVNSLKELIDYAKANPAKVLYATAGVGTPPHLTWARLKELTGTDIAQVSYKGASQSLLDVVAGRVQVYSGATGTVVPYVKAGKLRALAVLDKQRSKMLPDVPTATEAGVPGLEVNAWYGLFAPAGTPPEIVNQISVDLTKALHAPEVLSVLESLGNAPIYNIGPDKFTAFLKADLLKWKKAVDAAGARIE